MRRLHVRHALLHLFTVHFGITALTYLHSLRFSLLVQSLLFTKFLHSSTMIEIDTRRHFSERLVTVSNITLTNMEDFSKIQSASSVMLVDILRMQHGVLVVWSTERFFSGIVRLLTFPRKPQICLIAPRAPDNPVSQYAARSLPWYQAAATTARALDSCPGVARKMFELVLELLNSSALSPLFVI
jgi:hypothetical protein